MKYKGYIPASKSIMNRLLICGSYASDFQIMGHSNCDDVEKMRQGLTDLKNGVPVDCGSAGTVLRFLAFRASRMAGEHTLIGTKRLFSRPQNEIISILDELKVVSRLNNDSLVIESNGWNIPDSPVMVDRSRSSQFITGLALNSWSLERDVIFKWDQELVSEGYWEMTLRILEQLGMEFELVPGSISIRKGQIISARIYIAEPDYSSTFAVAAIAALAGELEVLRFPQKSLQPDSYFLNLLKAMNVPIELAKGSLMVKQAQQMGPVSCDINNCPDLFPVLAVLCSFAQGESQIYGAPHLAYKESDRLSKTKELLSKMGKKFEDLEDGLIIFGDPEANLTEFDYDTDHDHRLAFAAALARAKGYKIHLSDPYVVRKSFPEFWDVVGMAPN